jgi:hypothetical protein
MGFLTRAIERWFDRRCVGAILRSLSEAETFDPQRLAIYRLRLDRARTTAVSTEIPAEELVIQRGLADAILLGTRAYVVDGVPLALFGKPTALFAFRGVGLTPIASIVGEGQVYVDQHPFHFFSPDELREIAVWNGDRIGDLPGAPPPVEIFATSLGGTFPPTDLPNPPKGSPQPAPPSAPTFSCPPVLLFYGLCFQTPEEENGLSIEDPLWQETQNVANEFKRRGYTSKSWRAGTNGPASSEAGTFAEMMNDLSVDLAGQTNFCKCVDDQLVLYLAAHGYGRNPTGRVAMKFEPKPDSPEWVTWEDFLDALAKIPQIAQNPAKVYLLVESCRSGIVFEGGGTAPASLKGIHILTSCPDSRKLGAALGFSQFIVFALGRYKAVDWKHFVQIVKWQGPDSNGTSPRNGDLSGCRFTVTLAKVTYGGADLGDQWEYKITVDRTTTAIAKHQLKNSSAENRTDVVYDRLFGPCPSPVTLNPICAATEKGTFIDDAGESTSPLIAQCNGTAQTYANTVNVTTLWRGTAKLTFDFTIATTC